MILPMLSRRMSFRALKTKHDTPKYGLIYHASLIDQAGAKHKGKMSRVLAAKTALAVRVDALGDETKASIALDNRAKCEARLRQLETGSMTLSSGKGNVQTNQQKYEAPPTVNGTYNTAADVTVETAEKKKKKKKKKSLDAMEVEEPKTTESSKDTESSSKKRKASAEIEPEQTEETPKKVKKAKKAKKEASPPAAETTATPKSEKKKKKKSKKSKTECTEA